MEQVFILNQLTSMKALQILCLLAVACEISRGLNESPPEKEGK
ncbi:hypothetical protein [uncultured Rothia sp.]|nr:hypothetical protein [uncultured Rothia sp.]